MSELANITSLAPWHAPTEKVGPWHQQVPSRVRVTDHPTSSRVSGNWVHYFSVPDRNTLWNRCAGWSSYANCSKVQYFWCSWSRLDRGCIRVARTPAVVVQRVSKTRWYCDTIDRREARVRTFSPLSSLTHAHWCIGPHILTRPTRLTYLGVYDNRDSSCKTVPSRTVLLTHVCTPVYQLS